MMLLRRSVQQLQQVWQRWFATNTNPAIQSHLGETMSAWQINHYGGSEVFALNPSARIPAVQSPNDVLIEVHAASVNPIDVKMRGGYGRVLTNLMKNGLTALLPFLQPDVSSEFPRTLGRDFSGVVKATGQNVQKFQVGDEVWGAIGINRSGTHAQYVLAGETEIARKPNNITHIEAGSLPYVALTTWAALCNGGGIRQSNAENKRVLILAGSGGVGVFAIQLMKSWGAEVTTTCSTSAVEMCQSLGADHVIDYTKTDVDAELAKIQGFDVILDTIGANGPAVSLNLLKSFCYSKFVTIMHPFLGNTDRNGFGLGLAMSAGSLGRNVIKGLGGGRSYQWSFFAPNGEAMGIVKDLVESGKIVAIVEKVFPFEDVPAAFDKVAGPHARGKTVIDFKQLMT